MGSPLINLPEQEASPPPSNGHLSDGRSLGLFRTRLLLLLALVVLPAFGLVLYGNLEQRRIEKEGVRREAMALSRLATAAQRDYIKNSKQLLGTLTQFPFLLLSTNRDFSEMHLFNLRNLSPDYSNFGLIEVDGSLFCSAQRTNAGVYLGDRAYFRRVLQTRQFAVGDFQLGRLTTQPTQFRLSSHR